MRVLNWLVVITLSLAAAAFAAENDPIAIRGTIVGHDGKPMRAALIVLSGPGITSQKQSADPSGQFTFTAKEPGAYNLIFTGVHHKTLFMPVFVDKPRTIGLRIQLAASEYRSTLANLRVVGEFNKFSTESGGIAMQPQPDGTFVTTVGWKGETLSYAVQGVLDDDSDTICGTQADSFAQDKTVPFIDNANNELVSVVKANGQPIRIVFDPRALPRSTKAPDVQFDDPSVPAAAIFAIDRDLKLENRKVDVARKAYVAGGGDPKTFKSDYTPQMRYLERRVQEDRDLLTWAYAVLRYLQYPEAKSNVTLAQRVFTDIPATSYAWSLLWAGPENTFFGISRIAKSPDETKYVATAYETHPDRNVRAAFLYIALMFAFEKKDSNVAGRLYTRLMGDFGDTGYARRAVTMAPSRNVQPGKPVPDFSFVSLDAPGSTLTPKSLAGKTYLIDFWAVWCGPCVAEMPHLHAAYEKFKDKGLVMITVSLDDKASEVTAFRNTKWAMPWFNTRLAGFDDATAKAFEIVGIPKPVLVGPDGLIIAVDSGLRGENLLKTLARVFAGSEQR